MYVCTCVRASEGEIDRGTIRRRGDASFVVTRLSFWPSGLVVDYLGIKTVITSRLVDKTVITSRLVDKTVITSRLVDKCMSTHLNANVNVSLD